MLKDALCARRISSALVGRRSLVLRSQRGCPDYLEPARPADPQLYIFAAEAVQIVTTDGSDYQLAGGRTHPAADPGGAAQLVARYV